MTTDPRTAALPAFLARDQRWVVIGRWGLTVLRVIIGGVYLLAAADKIIHPDRFADVVWDYQMLPAWLVNPFAVCLPWVEVVVGLALLSGAWVPAGSLLSTGMALMFMIAVGVNLALGNTDLHCGCFSTSQEGEGNGWELLGKDLLLLAGSVGLWWATWRPRERWRVWREGAADTDWVDNRRGRASSEREGQA